MPNPRQPRFAPSKRSSVSKTSTIRNWVRVEEKKTVVAVEQSAAEKDAELITLRKENARLKEANEILKLTSAFFAQAELDRKLK